MAGALATSCSSSSKQVQHFAAFNPETREVGFYRLTLSGQSGLLADYTLKAGYFNRFTLDALTGNVQDPPEVSGDEAQLKALKRIRGDLYESLASHNSRVLSDRQDRQGLDRHVIGAARAFWIAGLDGANLASIGMSQSLDPFIFRKLVFWAESKTVDLSQLQAQFDNLIKNTRATVVSIRASAQQRESKNLRDARLAALTKFFVPLRASVGDDEVAIGLVDALEAAALLMPAEDSLEREHEIVRGLIGALRISQSALTDGSLIPVLLDALARFLRLAEAPEETEEDQ